LLLCGHRRRHQPVAPRDALIDCVQRGSRGPSWRCHFGPFARRHQHTREAWLHDQPLALSPPQAIQQLDPHHEGILHKLLSKPTQMPVIEAEDGTTLEPNHAELTKSAMEHGITGLS
jgi:hypothetical protein